MIALCWIAIGLFCAAPLLLGAIAGLVEGLKDIIKLFTRGE